MLQGFNCPLTPNFLVKIIFTFIIEFFKIIDDFVMILRRTTVSNLAPIVAVMLFCSAGFEVLFLDKLILF